MMQFKILVVDDEASIRTLVQTMMKRDGRHVAVAAGGKDAITVFRRERPDLTILDIDMPDIDGLAVLREIRAIDPEAKVIIFTGVDSPVIERQARELGASDFLLKGMPVPPLTEFTSGDSKLRGLEPESSPGASVMNRKAQP